MLSIIAVNKKYQFRFFSIILGGIFLCFYSSVSAQDTTLKNQHLPEFSVTEKLEKVYSNINTQQLDSSIIANNNTNNLATLLAKNSAVTIRSYGTTGLSSLSMNLRNGSK